MFGVAVWIWTRGQVSAPEGLWYLVVSFVFFPVAAAVHELGHLLPGLTQGRILSAIRIWPLTLERSPSGALQRSANLRTSDGLLGFVRWSSPGPELGRAADVVMLAGGPLANLAFASALFAVCGGSEASSEKLLALLRAAALCNTLAGVMNLLSFSTSPTGLSDGARILRVLRPGYRAFQLRERLLKRALVLRPREWGMSSRELTDEATSDPADRAWLLLLALAVALDRGDRAECDRVLAAQPHVTSAPSDVILEFALQRVLIQALLDGDAIAAREELTAAPASPRGYDDLALAAVLLAEGRSTEAAKALDVWALAADQHLGWIAGNQWAVDALRAALSSAPQTA
ncbi:MAG: hypothetical protein ACXU88_07360 [Myxococcaceae bacterium]